MFHGSFGLCVCDGDFLIATEDGYKVVAKIVYDEYRRLDDDDSHNPDRSVTGCDEEQHRKLMEARFAWSRGDWFYCGVVLSVLRADVMLCENAASLWGLEANYPGSDNKYLVQVANDLLPEAVRQGERVLNKLIWSRKKASA